MEPVQWENVFAQVRETWSTRIMDGLTYVAFLEGDERFLWVDVDGRDDLRGKFRIFAPAMFLINNERGRKLEPDQFDRYFALQFLEREISSPGGSSLDYFARYPERLELTIRGEWGYETEHFGSHGTSNFGGEPFHKVVRQLYERLLQEKESDDTPAESIEHKRLQVFFKIKRLFRNGGEQFDQLLR